VQIFLKLKLMAEFIRGLVFELLINYKLQYIKHKITEMECLGRFLITMIILSQFDKHKWQILVGAVVHDTLNYFIYIIYIW
jgi:hypothetical protein